MNKKAVILIGIFILLILLLCLYFVSKKDNNIENTEQEQSSQNNHLLINKKSDEVKRVIIENEYGEKTTFKTINNEDGTNSWTVEGFEELEFNQENLKSVVNTMAQLYAEDIVTNDLSNLSQYGLEPPQNIVTALYSDETEIAIVVGNMTPDKNYYYAMIEEDDNVYIIDKLTGQRINYDLNELISKTVPVISEKEILYLDVKQKGKDEIEIEYSGDMDGNAADLSKYGLQTLNMKKPIPNAIVYPNNIQSYVLSNTSALTIKDLIDIFPKDLSQYGLHEPELIINMRDSKNSVEFKIGSSIDENTFYCMVDERPHVFSIEKDAVNPFMDIDILNFIEKFVSLHYRKDVESVNISSSKGNYSITFGEEKTEETTENEVNDNRASFINGKEVDKDEFSNLFQLIVGITFDSIDYNAKPQGKPESSIIYTLRDGTKDIIEYYNYNDNFYIALKDNDSSRIVSKQTIKNVVNELSKFK